MGVRCKIITIHTIFHLHKNLPYYILNLQNLTNKSVKQYIYILKVLAFEQEMKHYTNAKKLK